MYLLKIYIDFCPGSNLVFIQQILVVSSSRRESIRCSFNCTVHFSVVIHYCDNMCLFWMRTNLCMLFCLFILVYRWPFNYQYGLYVVEHVCACPKQQPTFSVAQVVAFLVFDNLRSEIIAACIDISGIVDNHCWNSRFSKNRKGMEIPKG